jgi:hypothetical protein
VSATERGSANTNVDARKVDPQAIDPLCTGMHKQGAGGGAVGNTDVVQGIRLTCINEGHCTNRENNSDAMKTDATESQPLGVHMQK